MRTRPFPARYALAREWLELRRSQFGESNRTHAYQRAAGGMAALASVASSMELVVPGTMRFLALAKEVLGEMPIEPGPEWLDRAAEALAARLEEPSGG